MTSGQVRVAIVGAGEIGRGWAALCAASGWPVSIFDTDSRAADEAPDEITMRARMLVGLDRAVASEVQSGIDNLVVGRSLLHACREAEWIIESVPEDLVTKQKLIESIEGVAGHARVITSSTSGLQTKDIVARSIRPQRFMIAHPLNPPELVPLVEIVPGPDTDRTLVELTKGWLRALGRVPVEIRKPIQGNVANRIAAAVWREAIDLVLEGVIGVDDLDRAVSVGPALGWAAAGPHLTYHLGAGEGGVAGFLQQLLQTFEGIWQTLPSWSRLEPDQQRRLVSLVEKAYEENLDVIRSARDRRLAAILRGLELARDEKPH